MAAERLRALRLVSQEVTNALLGEADRQTLHARLLALYTPQFRGVARNDAHVVQMAHDSLDEERAAAIVETFVAATGRSISGLRTLEVGAGVGLSVAVARHRYGADAIGVEPGAAEYGGTLDVAHEILARAGLPAECIVEGVGESLPFPDASFDVVLSSNVLEHVRDPARVIAEMVRVLKPGGHLQIVVPNYGSWWEGHYGVLWLPHMPRFLAKVYVRALGRDVAYVDTLTFVTLGRLRRWIAPQRARLEILDWGEALWQRRLRHLDFGEYAALGRLKQLLRMLRRLGVVPLLERVGLALGWHTPIVLTARRTTAA
jgi:SAM-dependent methyltransferase